MIFFDMWTGHLVGKAMRTIPKEDFELIKKKGEKEL
jgi:predicted RNA-binding protein